MLSIVFILGLIFFGYGFFVSLRKREIKIALGSLVFIVISVFGIFGLFDSTSNETSGITENKKVKQEANEESEKSEITQTTSAESIEREEDAPLTSGENGVLAEDVFVGLGEDKTNYEEMFSYITKDNYEALQQMVLEGRATFATKGTPITVVERGFASAKIQITATGERGWVPVEYLVRKVE